MFCSKCGTKNAEGVKFCGECGASLNGGGNSNNNLNNYNNMNNIPYEYKPISMWGYFGYELLFMIPCIGTILLIVFALGGTSNKNLKNFARSYFCLLILLIVLFLIIAVVAGSIGAAAGISSSIY